MKICLFGTYQAFHPRNVALIEALKKLNFEILECHVSIWDDIQDRSKILTRKWWGLWILWGQMKAWIGLFFRYWFLPDHDVILVLYQGHFEIFLASLLARLRRKRVIFDAFLSLSDLYTTDRKYASSDSLIGKFLSGIDKTACGLADKVLVDTPEHAEFFHKNFGVAYEKLSPVPVGCDESIFYPREETTKTQNVFKVLYFGNYLPFHGTEVIVKAIEILRKKDDSVQWTLIGDGQDFIKTTNLAKELQIAEDIQFISEWVRPQDLAVWIRDADICLGAFADCEKIDRVVPCKVYIALAMKKTIVTAESLAVMRFLEDRAGVFFCERGNAESLANAILALKEAPQLGREIAETGYRIYQNKASVSARALQLSELIREVVQRN